MTDLVLEEYKSVIGKDPMCLLKEEYDFLKHLPFIAPDGPIIEIGSGQANSTIAFAKSGRELHCIDVKFSDNWKSKIAQLGFENIIKHEAPSRDMLKIWELKAAIVFVDGGHGERDVFNDCEFSKFLLPNGFIAFHDYHQGYMSLCKAVKPAVDKWRMAAQDNLKLFQSVKSIICFKNETL
jgi:hypothetical protein